MLWLSAEHWKCRYVSCTLNQARSEYLQTACTDRKLTHLKRSIRESQLSESLMRQRLKGSLNLMRPWSCWRRESELMLQGAASSSRCFYFSFEPPFTPFHLNYCYDCNKLPVHTAFPKRSHRLSLADALCGGVTQRVSRQRPKRLKVHLKDANMFVCTIIRAIRV